jgi:hypothetical protein
MARSRRRSYPRGVRSSKLSSVARVAAIAAAIAVHGCSHESPPPLAPPAPPPDPPPSAPQTLAPASVDFDVVNLFLDDKFAYWAHRGEKGLVKVPLSGGPEVTLVPGTEQPVTSLASDARYLYFTTGRRVDTEASDMLLGRKSPRAGHFEGVVARLEKKPGAQVEEVSSGRFKPEDVALDANNVYWVMAKKDETLVRQTVGQVDAPVVVAHGDFLPGSLTVAGGFAFWIDTGRGSVIMRVPTNGGEPERVEAGAGAHPVRPGADDGGVYFSDAGPSEGKGSIVRVALDGKGIALIADGLATPRAVAARGGLVYWLTKGTSANNYADGALEKAPASGGAKVTLATGLMAPDRLALSDTRVAWTESSGAIKDMAR